jgi:hypothetical protein
MVGTQLARVAGASECVSLRSNRRVLVQCPFISRRSEKGGERVPDGQSRYHTRGAGYYCYRARCRPIFSDSAREYGFCRRPLYRSGLVLHNRRMFQREATIANKTVRTITSQKSLGTRVAAPRLASFEETILSAPDNETKFGDNGVTLGCPRSTGDGLLPPVFRPIHRKY